jgi:hypothetical protein
MATKPKLNWDRLLDGETYVLDLDQIGWPTGLADLRAKVHYEVDRRRGVAHTRKLAPSRLEIYAEGARVKSLTSGPCNCGAPFWDFHRIVCSSLGDRAATLVGGGTYQEAMRLKPRPAPPAPQDQPPTTEDPVEDPEALLGPCTCGQDPRCLPSCERFS